MDGERDTMATPSPNIAEDYSDLGSTKSEEIASDRTKHQQGVLKQDDLGSTNSDEPASDRKTYKRGGRKEDTSRWNSLSSRLPPLGPDDESDGEEEQEKEPSCADEPTDERQPRPRAKPFKTGISSFNLKRAEGSGGRPMGVTVDDPTTKVSAEHEFDQPKRKTTPDKGKQRERPQREPEEKKPVQIRLDLNLMIEVFLRAKIQGDVTITFL
jgi:uncharacterized protein (DUF4415 family)